MAWYQNGKNGVILTLKATPRASKTELIGVDPDWVRVRIQAPPVDGKANAELIVFFAKAFKIAKRDVEILTGGTGRLKRVQLSGVTEAALLQHLTDIKLSLPE